MATAAVKYNPGIFGDEELVRSFAVRQNCLELVLEALRENAAGSLSNRHLLIVGPRGIGKTTLVRRVAAEVKSNPAYGEKWFPIVFGEESYQVLTAGEFWLEALNHLSEEKEGEGLRASIDELREETKDATLRERALAQLLDFADRSGKRLLLVVENLDMICEQISRAAEWELRHTLGSEPRIMLLATAPSRFGAITDAGRAWYEFFAILQMKPLDNQESSVLWEAVSKQRLTSRQIRAIQILTGGNPRLLSMMAGFGAKRPFCELFEQLVHLIDDHTEYFKGHLDRLAPKERKVFVALLEKWDPAPAADLAKTARLSVNETSALLNRLVSRGAVELFEDKPRRKLYQAAERLYNIYYLMRRRGEPSDRVRAAVRFMVIFYDREELAGLTAGVAREARALPEGKSADHLAALFQMMPHVPKALRRKAMMILGEACSNREDAAIELERLLGAASAIVQANWGILYFNQGRLVEAEEALKRALEHERTSVLAWACLGEALARLDRRRESDEAFRTAANLAQNAGSRWTDFARSLRVYGAGAEITDPWERANARIDLCRSLGESLEHLEEWARGSIFSGGDMETWAILLGVLRDGGKWSDVIRVACDLIEHDGYASGASAFALAMLLNAASKGFAPLAEETLKASRNRLLSEPFIAGLQIYQGAKPQVAQEILTVGEDVAATIRGIEQRRPASRPASTRTAQVPIE